MQELIEQVPNTYPHLFWGYFVLWVLILGYIASLGRRMYRVERKIEENSKAKAES